MKPTRDCCGLDFLAHCRPPPIFDDGRTGRENFLQLVAMDGTERRPSAPLTRTLKLTNALFREGRDFDLLPLPGLTHMVPDPVVMQRMYGKFAEYFRKHLGDPRG